MMKILMSQKLQTVKITVITLHLLTMCLLIMKLRNQDQKRTLEENRSEKRTKLSALLIQCLTSQERTLGENKKTEARRELDFKFII